MNDINWKERCEEAEVALANALADESGLKQADQLMMNKLQRIQELEEINESHRKINGDLRRQITALEQEKLELFLDNKTGEQIATIVNQEFDLELKAPTIYAWAKKYDWKGENASMTTKAKEIVKEKQSQRIARLQNEHLDSYEKILVEEITDPDVITKVANRLRRLVAERDDIE